jgi:hypothetical protein
MRFAVSSAVLASVAVASWDQVQGTSFSRFAASRNFGLDMMGGATIPSHKTNGWFAASELRGGSTGAFFRPYGACECILMILGYPI